MKSVPLLTHLLYGVSLCALGLSSHTVQSEHQGPPSFPHASMLHRLKQHCSFTQTLSGVNLLSVGPISDGWQVLVKCLPLVWLAMGKGSNKAAGQETIPGTDNLYPGALNH